MTYDPNAWQPPSSTAAASYYRFFAVVWAAAAVGGFVIRNQHPVAAVVWWLFCAVLCVWNWGISRDPTAIAGDAFKFFGGALGVAAVLFGWIVDPRISIGAFILLGFAAVISGEDEQTPPTPQPKPMPHGSAHFAELHELAAASLVHPPGVWVPDNELILGEAYGLWLRYGMPNSLLTIGASGGGKFASVIAPNLLHYTGGSAIVLDPKGEAAAVTADFRRGIGKVFIINPFNVLADILGPSHGTDPLQALDPESETFTSDAETLAASIVPDGGDTGRNGDFFRQTARNLIAGLIVHLRLQGDSLVGVSDVLHMPPDEFTIAMQHMRASHFAIVRDAAADMLDSGRGKQESVLDTLRTARSELKTFMNAEGIRRVLSRHDFTWSDLKREKITIYIVLPEAESKAFSRFTRLLLASALKALLRHEQHDPVPVYFVLDELATSVGESELDLIETAVSLGRGYGVRMHLFFQNQAQLNAIFEKRAASLESGAGVTQYFEVADEVTFEKLRSRAGKTTIWTPHTSNQHGSGRSGGESVGHNNSSASAGWNTSEGTTSSEQATQADLITPELAYQLGSIGGGRSVAQQILFFRGLASPVHSSRSAYFALPYFTQRAAMNPYNPTPPPEPPLELEPAPRSTFGVMDYAGIGVFFAAVWGVLYAIF
jgi:type IV secretion system protein VirD4